MSILSYSLPGVLDAQKFQIVANKGVGTYRLIYQQVDACPAGPQVGCEICKRPTMIVGRHPRPIEQVDVAVTDQVRGAWGKPNLLAHRWRLTPVTLTIGGVAYAEGEGWHAEGREIVWHEDAPVTDQDVFGYSYRAYREDWVSTQHAYVDFAGGPRQAEASKNMNWAQVDQGMVAITIPATAAGYRPTQFDRFIPVDAAMDFDAQVDTAAGMRDTHSRHQFVTEIMRAYGLNDKRDRELDFDGVTFDPSRRRFIFPQTTLPSRVIVKYRAAPIYTLYLDQGEFRHQQGQNHGRLVTLQREEIAR